MSTSDSLPQHISISAIDGQIDTLTESASIRYAIESFIKSQVVDAGKPSPTEVKATRLEKPQQGPHKVVFQWNIGAEVKTASVDVPDHPADAQ